MSIQSIHPFPARMAPELALRSFGRLHQASTVLDPMAGSGIVVRHAVELGHRAIGFDIDPLAVLISRAWTTPVDDKEIKKAFSIVQQTALELDPHTVALPWIDYDEETAQFIEYWFGRSQILELRCLAYTLQNAENTFRKSIQQPVLDILKVALSRIIVTKEQCASLARDTSHSRPHKVAETSNYRVFVGFERSVSDVRKRLQGVSLSKRASISPGDARHINLPNNSIDFVLTSPPYLNAIDYLRAHRLSLVWLGHTISELRKIRSESIGSERGLAVSEPISEAIMASMGKIDLLPERYKSMIRRYTVDVSSMMKEIARVLKPGCYATLVVGDSCLKGIFVKNSDAIVASGKIAGLKMISRLERKLPNSSRYLPLPRHGPLGKRMRTEVIITMKKSSKQPTNLGNSRVRKIVSRGHAR